ncbi:hypothetical protein [Streptomyces sp. NBC_00140]|uniref:hypothetical protein n=1 Tax=Streptomyces sp. NBC_00140 TaxID=2975664 RepID=UPI002250D1B7|nr:hypothetical protein [Streptomyces sp. NBC_00140]MCX5332106.1 hypothetical protein [Streptomyces sp. NBC_00140]
MTIPPPLPESVTLPDTPVIRRRAYLAVCASTPGLLSCRWHVWHANGTYAGYCTDPDLIDMTISVFERRTGST